MGSPFKLNIYEESNGTYSNDIMDEVIDLDEETEFVEPESKIDHHYDVKNSPKGAMKGGDLELSEDEYNDAIDAVQKSIKSDHALIERTSQTLQEAYQVLETLRNATVIPGTSQESFAEAAMLSAYEDGPWFEAAAKEDANEGECKKKAKSLRGNVIKEAKKDGIDVVKVAVLSKGEVEKEDELWKVVGVVIAAKDTAEGFAKVLEERLSGKLDGCKLAVSKATKAQMSAINSKRKTPADEAYIIKIKK